VINKMNEKKLVTCNGAVGLVGGIFLLVAPLFLFGSVVSDLSSSGLNNSVNIGATSTLSLLILIVKIAILVLGIIGAVKLKHSDKIASAPSVLLIVGGGVSLIPFLGFIGGVVSIVGGSIYLANLKKFNT
jgi:hypothetical protein